MPVLIFPSPRQGSVWIAPSSIQGFAGYGVFTTRDLELDESILGIPDGVAIPVETKWDASSPKQAERKAWWHVWGNYVYVFACVFCLILPVSFSSSSVSLIGNKVSSFCLDSFCSHWLDCF